MELSYIPKSGTWSEMANLLNGNFGSIISEIGALGDNLDLCKGVFDYNTTLSTVLPSPQLNSWAYVKHSPDKSDTVFEIWRYEDGTPTPSWTNTTKTENLSSIGLGISTFTEAEVVTQISSIAQAYLEQNSNS